METKAALLRVHNDLVGNIDNQKTTVLLELHISAALDTIDFIILTDLLRLDFDLCGTHLITSILDWRDPLVRRS